ncbi:AraC family transcriptional regulator ligand-binding domain-containing protein [Nocardia gipuzkoensis]
MDAGARYRLTFNGIWAFAVVTSPTVRHAFRIGVDYVSLGYSFATWRFAEQDTAAVVTIDYSATPAEVRTFLIERDLACLAVIDREIFGTLMKPDSVELSCPEPAYADRFPDLIGLMPTFDAPQTRILLSEPALDVPLPQGSLQLAELARQQAAQASASKCAEFCWRTGWTPTRTRSPPRST